MVFILYRDELNYHSGCILHWDWTKKDDIYRDYQLSFWNHSPLGLDKERWYLYSIEMNLIVTPDAFATGIGQRKMVSIRDYLILTPDAFSTGMGQRKMVSKEINSIVTPDAFFTGIGQRQVVYIIYRDYSILIQYAFSTGIGQRQMLSIEITLLSLLMYSPQGVDKERWHF